MAEHSEEAVHYNRSWIEEELIAAQRICELEFSKTGFSDCEMNDTSTHNGLNHPLSYRIIATILHLIIFVCGVAGNIVLIIVARRTKALQKPTYCYLTSLAYADLIVLISAVPEAVISHHIGVRWIFGQIGCSLLVFTNFLGINAGSLSILAFTIERYIAVLKPILAQKVCTVERARKIIVVLWIISILYCAPWLGLTEVRSDRNAAAVELCDFRLSTEQYTYFFVADLILFYIVPLLCATFVYGRIAGRLRFKSEAKSSPKLPYRDSEVSMSYTGDARTQLRSDHYFSGAGSFRRSVKPKTRRQSRTQALHVLMVVVLIFAVCWLPYRGLLVYNSFIGVGWWDIWFLLFAKTLIYVNSAINPIIYNFMSTAFHDAVVDLFRRRRGITISISMSI